MIVSVELQQRVALCTNPELTRALLMLQASRVDAPTKDRVALIVLDRTPLPEAGH